MGSEEGYRLVDVQVDGMAGVATVSLNRPEKRNALNGLMVDELADAVAWADSDARVGAILLRGKGEDFCAGADLEELSEMAEAGVEEHLADADALGDLFLIFRRIATPIVAAVHGRAIAGGCGLATACDVVLASEAARFGYPEITIGFVPAMVIAMLRRAVGEKRAFDLVATGRLLDAKTAQSYGLVQHVYADAEFEDRSREFAGELARRSRSAVALSKRLLYQSEQYSFESAIRAGADINVLARMTEDCREGVRSFLEARRRKEKD